jgi:hypothetical protein
MAEGGPGAPGRVVAVPLALDWALREAAAAAAGQQQAQAQEAVAPTDGALPRYLAAALADGELCGRRGRLQLAAGRLLGATARS